MSKKTRDDVEICSSSCGFWHYDPRTDTNLCGYVIKPDQQYPSNHSLAFFKSPCRRNLTSSQIRNLLQIQAGLETSAQSPALCTDKRQAAAELARGIRVGAAIGQIDTPYSEWLGMQGNERARDSSA